MTEVLHSPPTLLALNILASTTEAVIAINSTNHIVLLNPAAQTLTGLSLRQAIDQPITTIFKGQKGLLYLIHTAMSEGRSISDRETIQLSRPHAPELPISATASPLFTDNGHQEGVILILHDASNLRQLEQDVQRVDRLAMLGTLAAGLAHEIKNPLGGVKGAAQLLAMELTGRQDLLEYTAVMIKETDRINEIIDELMDLSTPRPQALNDVNLSKVITDIVLLQKQSPDATDTRFILQLDPTIPPIIGDQTLLTRLFLNIIKNAAEATTTDGKITISTRIDTEHHLTRPGQGPTPFVVIKITDNGCGISKSVLKNIFTPFYTTKNFGSGLGLAISQKIVSDHDGLLHLESIQGQGTCCTIHLPFKRDKK
ncbi:MAG: PAS domain-containing protein [Desulfuromonas sp.]|nr:PAS domain-containing protein [Desulfuromonas sp.]